MGFTQGTIDFLFENRLHDSREWFGEHKQDYKALVTEPLGVSPLPSFLFAGGQLKAV